MAWRVGVGTGRPRIVGHTITEDIRICTSGKGRCVRGLYQAVRGSGWNLPCLPEGLLSSVHRLLFLRSSLAACRTRVFRLGAGWRRAVALRSSVDAVALNRPESQQARLAKLRRLTKTVRSLRTPVLRREILRARRCGRRVPVPGHEAVAVLRPINQ